MHRSDVRCQCVLSQPQIFNPRVEDLEKKYETLYEHLNKYASALSQAESPQDETGYEVTVLDTDRAPMRGADFRITLTAHVFRTD